MAVKTPNGKPIYFIFSDPDVEQRVSYTVPVEFALLVAEHVGNVPVEVYVVIVGDFESVVAVGEEALQVYRGLAADENMSVCDIITAMARHDCTKCPIPDCPNRQQEYVF